MDIPLWQDVLTISHKIAEAHPFIAEHFLLNKKNKKLFIGILRAETILPINTNNIGEVNSLCQPLKSLIEKLVNTPSVIYLLIQAEIKSLFAHRHKYLQMYDKKYVNELGKSFFYMQNYMVAN